MFRLEMANVKFLLVAFITLIKLNICFGLTPEQQQEVKRIVEDDFISPNLIPGVGLAVVEENGAVNFASGYGLMDVENSIPVTNKTRFGIASITKTFTGTLVAKVLNEKFPELGEFALDTPIQQLYPNGNFTFIDRYRSEAMSFRDILSHRHGLQFTTLGLVSESSSGLDEFAYRTRYAPEVYPHRMFGVYNNEMYSLAGKLIGEIAGSSYPQLLEDLFQQLGMNDTTYWKDSIDPSTLPGMSKGYYLRDSALLEYNLNLTRRTHVSLPAGGIITTAEDMTKYLAFQLNLGKVGDTQVVPENVMKWIRQPALALTPEFKETDETDLIDTQLALGAGLGIGIYDGWMYFHHDGLWAPFTGRLTFYPNFKLGIFSVINGPNDVYYNSYSHYDLHQAIFNLVRGKTPTSKHPDSKQKLRTPIPSPSNLRLKTQNENRNKQATYAGMFGNPIEGDMEITANGGNQSFPLYMKLGKWLSGYLSPALDSTNTFLITWDTDFYQDYYFNFNEMTDTYIQFENENKLNFVLLLNTIIQFVRGEVLDSFPEIPWDPQSCSRPDTFKSG